MNLNFITTSIYITHNTYDKYTTKSKLNLDIESDKLVILRNSFIDKALKTMVFIDNKGIFYEKSKRITIFMSL